MEQRWSVRAPFTTQVILHHNALPVAVCTSSDIGLGGLFIKTGPLTYPRNSVLHIDIELNTELGPKRFLLETTVVFSSGAGMGLMFLESNSEITRTIRQLLLDAVDHEMPIMTLA
jgi:hypothetical protein